MSQMCYIITDHLILVVVLRPHSEFFIFFWFQLNVVMLVL